jgi:hypothetical protein
VSSATNQTNTTDLDKVEALTTKIEARTALEAKRKAKARDFKKELAKLDREIEEIAAEIRQS